MEWGDFVMKLSFARSKNRLFVTNPTQDPFCEIWNELYLQKERNCGNDGGMGGMILRRSYGVI